MELAKYHLELGIGLVVAPRCVANRTTRLKARTERRNWTERNWTPSLISLVQFSYVALYAP